jgi:Protein of unknown function (DUF2808)
MRISPVFHTVRNYSCGLLGALCFSLSPAWAGQVRGETFFEHMPVLMRSTTNNDSATYNYARYSFEIAVPQNSGEPLGGLTVIIPKAIEIPDADKVRVTDSTGQPVAFQENLLGKTVQLTFGQPLSPGQKITVQFYPMPNPHGGGIYLFDISALPAGSNPHPQFLSFGRLTFYQGGGRR